MRLVDVCTPILFQVFPALFEPSIDFIMAVMDQSAARRLELLRSRRATSPCFHSSNRCFGVRKEWTRSIRSKTWTARGAGHCVRCCSKRSSSQGHSWSDRILWSAESDHLSATLQPRSVERDDCNIGVDRAQVVRNEKTRNADHGDSPVEEVGGSIDATKGASIKEVVTKQHQSTHRSTWSSGKWSEGHSSKFDECVLLL